AVIAVAIHISRFGGITRRLAVIAVAIHIGRFGGITRRLAVIAVAIHISRFGGITHRLTVIAVVPHRWAVIAHPVRVAVRTHRIFSGEIAYRTVHVVARLGIAI